MCDLKIDIAGTPPTVEQIAEWREDARQDAARADAAERRIKSWGWASAIFVALVLATLWGTGLIAGSYAVTVVVIAAIGGAIAGIEAKTIVVVVAVTGAVAVAWTGDAGDMAVAVAGAVAWLVFIALVEKAYNKWVKTPRTRAKDVLAALTELSPEAHPDECIAYYEWCEKDETLQQYQRQIAAQERHPIMAEYDAAMSWVAASDERQSQAEKIETARLACERLRTVDHTLLQN